MAELGAFFPASPQHLKSPLHRSPDNQTTDLWAEFFGENSGDHVPSHNSIQDWNRVWADEPASRSLPSYDQMQLGGLQAQQTLGMSILGLGGHNHPQTWEQSQDTPLKQIFEAHCDPEMMRPSSPGWQLQDIFATPPAAPARQLSESSDEIDDEALYELTLKSNALHALRDANLCGPGMVDEVTKGIGELQVDPKTSFMSKIIGMLSPSLLGFPINSKPRRKKAGPRSLLCMDTAIRRNERPATRSASLMTSRRAQASACKRLGLIRTEEEFNEEVFSQYLRLFQAPLSRDNLHGLAMLAETAERPGFVLSQDDLTEMLRETPTVF
jgi:hypothetical protein